MNSDIGIQNNQSFPNGDKIIRLSEIFNVTTDYLLKGVETDPIDIYSTHNSKAGADMSAEVIEKLNRVHSISDKKRLSIGLGITVVIVVLIIGIFYFL